MNNKHFMMIFILSCIQPLYGIDIYVLNKGPETIRVRIQPVKGTSCDHHWVPLLPPSTWHKWNVGGCETDVNIDYGWYNDKANGGTRSGNIGFFEALTKWRCYIVWREYNGRWHTDSVDLSEFDTEKDKYKEVL